MATNEPDKQQKPEIRFASLTTENLQKITRNLNSTLGLGLIAGFTAIVGYTFNLNAGGWKLMFLFILLASASYMSGFFLGFLFGIPKRNIDKESAYNLSTNLVDISDWLTKIIIGLGLIEIKRIPGYLQSIGNYIQEATGSERSVSIFSTCTIVYFSIFGLYYGYNYMRLFLSGQFKEADDNLLLKEQKLSDTRDELNKEDLAPSNINESSKIKIKEYDQLLQSTKIENDYTFEDWYYRGISAYDRQEYNNVVTYMRKALEKNPVAKNAPDAHLYLGIAYSQLKQYDQALVETTKVIDNFKDYSFSYLAFYNNGTYYEKLGMEDKALAAYETSIVMKPEAADAWSGKGYILIKRKDFSNAIDALEKATKYNVTDHRAWYNKACAHALEKQKQPMLESLRKAIELNPDYKNKAKNDPWLQNFANDPDFLAMLN